MISVGYIMKCNNVVYNQPFSEKTDNIWFQVRVKSRLHVTHKIRINISALTFCVGTEH
jgi:hypothetical protein